MSLKTKTKTKQKQKQKQKQSQTVIVNVAQKAQRRRRRATKKTSGSAPPPPPSQSPQFVPYPVPNLRGPEPMVASQPSLIQLLDVLKQIKAPVAPAVPPPIQIPPPRGDEKDEALNVGGFQMVGQDSPFVESDSPFIYGGTTIGSSSSSVPPLPSSSSSSSSSSSASASSTIERSRPILRYLTKDALESLHVNRSQAGAPSLYDYANSINVTIPKYIPNTNKQRPTKEYIIELLLRKTNPLPSRIPRPKAAPEYDE